MATACDVVSAIRDVRNQNQVKPRDLLNVAIQNGPTAQALYADPALMALVVKMANLSSFAFTDAEPPMSKTVMSGTEKYYVELAGQINVEEEMAKLTKELAHQQGFVKSVEAKLSNERFVAGAPAQVIEVERRKLADGQERIRMIEESLLKLKV